MKTLKATLITIGLIALTLTIVYAYYGGFKKVTFQTMEQGGEMLFYKDLTGDYKQSGTIMNQVYVALSNAKVKTTKGFGIYYDNPKQVAIEKLRSEVGCIIETEDTAKITQLMQNYKTKIFPKGTYLVTEFPNKGKISIIMGIMKVYPAMEKFIKEKGYNEKGPVMEIYDTPNQKIIYRKEIIKE